MFQLFHRAPLLQEHHHAHCLYWGLANAVHFLPLSPALLAIPAKSQLHVLHLVEFLEPRDAIMTLQRFAAIVLRLRQHVEIPLFPVLPVLPRILYPWNNGDSNWLFQS